MAHNAKPIVLSMVSVWKYFNTYYYNKICNEYKVSKMLRSAPIK